jgi:16S rRNA (cytosine967-C5)-methyltransferase
MATPAREAAFDILLRVEQRQAYASELLHGERVNQLSPQDRHLCTELVMGALRWRARLDLGIGAVSSQRLDKLDPEVLTALRLGAYQIAFLRLPGRAAVNESVELVKRARRRYSVPFANAVLRKLAANPELMEPAQPPGSRTVLNLAQLYSHPLWLVQRWAAAYGVERAEKICAYDQQVPGTALRLTQPVAPEGGATRAGQPAAVEEELRRDSIELAPGVLLRSARRVTKGDVTRTRTFAEGRVAVQDEASQLVALLLGRGERLLDCCAAPGGKTAILAEQNPRSAVIATDLHPKRAAMMQRRLAAQKNVRVLASDAGALPLAAEFDRVLADVPCSGTGTLAHHPEIKWRLAADQLAGLHEKQLTILRAALERVRAGGRLLYSSCSLEREENANVVHEALHSTNNCRLIDCREELQRLREAGELVWGDVDSLLEGPFLRTIPGVQPCDGFFAAIIQKG